MITEKYHVDLDSPRRELFIRGLGFIVALLVRWQIIFFVGSYWTSNPAVLVAGLLLSAGWQQSSDLHMNCWWDRCPTVPSRMSSSIRMRRLAEFAP